MALQGLGALVFFLAGGGAFYRVASVARGSFSFQVSGAIGVCFFFGGGCWSLGMRWLGGEWLFD